MSVSKEAELYLEKSIGAISGCAQNLSEAVKIASQICSTLRSGNKILFCGNGGSAAQCQHLAAEFSGKFLINRGGLAALSLTVDTSALTAIGNDFGFDHVFSRQVRALGNRGDLLFGISTSGSSANVLNAVKAANELDISTVTLTGGKETELSTISDISIQFSSHETNYIQECHFVIGHLICYLVERDMFNSGDEN